jgi:septal ring factor EnvC (AmiA/AmiB activator)
MDWVNGGNELLGLVLAAIALLGLVGRWFWGRVSSRVKYNLSGLTSGHDDIKRRLGEVEQEQTSMKDDVRRIDTHLSKLEGQIGSLATKEDVSRLAISLAEVKATGNATSRMVDSLYRGVVGIAERKE